MVYVAGPYSRGNPVRNTARAMEVWFRLLACGLCPFIPHLSLLLELINPLTYEQWMEYDFEVVRRCDALLRIPGESPGADREVEFARSLCIPVFFDEAALLAWAGCVPPEGDELVRPAIPA
jgi:hypothetical protein